MDIAVSIAVCIQYEFPAVYAYTEVFIKLLGYQCKYGRAVGMNSVLGHDLARNNLG